MAYENDDYRALKSRLSNYEMVKQYADLARLFRSMKFGERLYFRTVTNLHEGALEASLKQSLKDEVVEFAAQKCEDLAVKLMTPDKEFDLRKACHE